MKKPSGRPLVFRGTATRQSQPLGSLRQGYQRDTLNLPLFRTSNGLKPVAVRDDAEASALPVVDPLGGLEGTANILRESADARPTINETVRAHTSKVYLIPKVCQAMSDDPYPKDEYTAGMVEKRVEREERAARLREARVNAGYRTMADAIRDCGWPKETYKAHENGRNGYDTAQARQYARRYKVSAAWLMTGTDENPEMETAVQTAPVVGEVAAGRWLAVDYHDEAQWAPVPFVPGRYADLPQTAYRVVGPSMDLKKIEDGDFLITVPYEQARSAPQSGDIVVVEIHHAGLVERTCKELIAGVQNYELWPRSSHPAYRDPIIIPRSGIGSAATFSLNDDEKVVKLAALVIGRFRPFGLNY